MIHAEPPTHEEVMRTQLRAVGNPLLPRAKRLEAWREYQRLHGLRTPEEVERMERERGLR